MGRTQETLYVKPREHSKEWCGINDKVYTGNGILVMLLTGDAKLNYIFDMLISVPFKLS